MRTPYWQFGRFRPIWVETEKRSTDDHGERFMRKTSAALALTLLAAASLPALAADSPSEVSIYALTDTGVGDLIGTLSLKDSKQGLVLTPKLAHLPPGQHGIHVHQLPDCRAVE